MNPHRDPRATFLISVAAAAMLVAMTGRAGAGSRTSWEMAVSVVSVGSQVQERDQRFELAATLKLVACKAHELRADCSRFSVGSLHRVQVVLERKEWAQHIRPGARIVVDYTEGSSLTPTGSESWTQWTYKLPAGTSYEAQVGASEPAGAVASRDEQRARLAAFLKKQRGALRIIERGGKGMVIRYRKDRPDAILAKYVSGKVTLIGNLDERVLKNPERAHEFLSVYMLQLSIPELQAPGWNGSITTSNADLSKLRSKNGRWEGRISTSVTELSLTRDHPYCRPPSAARLPDVCLATVATGRRAVHLELSIPMTLVEVDCAKTPGAEECR